MPPTFVADIQQAFNAASREWEAATERYNDKEQLSALALVASRWQPPLRCAPISVSTHPIVYCAKIGDGSYSLFL